MNYLKVGTILVSIFLFRYIFTSFETSFLNENSVKLLLMVYLLLYTKKMLKKMNFFAFIIAVSIEFYVSKWLYKTYINQEYTLVNDYYLIAIFLCSIIVVMCITKSMIKEIEENEFISFLISKLENYLYIYNFFYFFTNTFYSSVVNINDFFTIRWNDTFFYFFVSLLYLFLLPLICNFTRYINSFINKDYYMKILIRKYMLTVCVSIAFIVNYNSQFGNYIYNILFTYLSQPYNSLIYNLIPFNKDFRFKILLLILFEYFN
jgi:hypothetical protein